jgi:hypothetical protein
MPRATALLREKVIDEHGNILELVIWSVPATSRTPSGVRYRLAFVKRGEDDPAVLYDNPSPMRRSPGSGRPSKRSKLAGASAAALAFTSPVSTPHGTS